MNRGDRRETLFQDDPDGRRFLETLETLGEACAQTAWQVHAYCLMANHFHLVLETPHANLVAGMKWFLGTCTSRFNRRHKLFGHLFSGRYKALVVEGGGNGYLHTVCDYVHLNPARANLLALEQALRDYPWSRYGEYLQGPGRRAAWLRVDRLWGEMGIPQDSAAGREQFATLMEERGRQEEPGGWQSIRRGWCVGGEEFRQELLEQMSEPMGRQRYGGTERQEIDEAKAERLLAEESQRRQWGRVELEGRRKGDQEKVKIAWRLRCETTMTLDWIAQRLAMGSAGYAAQGLREAKEGKKDTILRD